MASPPRRRGARKKRPSIRPEKQWAALTGAALVAGVDEAGRGPIAGPVVAAAVIWDLDGRRPSGLADSKTLTALQRERLSAAIQRRAVAWAVGEAEAAEIDTLNIYKATLLAAERAVRALAPQPEALVTDFLEIPNLGLPTLSRPKADRDSASVAAASIIAKVHRDRLMDAYHAEFPEYRWHSNRGYPTPDHYAAVVEHGPTILHRFTFAGVGFFEQARHSPTFERLHRLLETCPDGPPLDELAEEITMLVPRLPPPEQRLLADALACRLEEQVDDQPHPSIT